MKSTLFKSEDISKALRAAKDWILARLDLQEELCDHSILANVLIDYADYVCFYLNTLETIRNESNTDPASNGAAKET